MGGGIGRGVWGGWGFGGGGRAKWVDFAWMRSVVQRLQSSPNQGRRGWVGRHMACQCHGHVCGCFLQSWRALVSYSGIGSVSL